MRLVPAGVYSHTRYVSTSQEFFIVVLRGLQMRLYQSRSNLRSIEERSS